MATLATRIKRRLRGGFRARPHTHTHRHFTEEELLSRADEFNANAESHWQSIRRDEAGLAHALNKPMSTVQDTGPMLYRLGLLITELRLGVGHTVLDFAAGSCWLSSLLNRLRCRTVAIDVSPSALQVGQELFRLDPRQRLDLDPRFVPYDGRTIPLEDESVDRIAVFDAFHHVPNQDQVLGEMARVLRPGGRVVMAEPGESHSHSDQSHMEMERFGVLENDIHFDELAKKARAAGFTTVTVKPYAGPEAFTFSEGEFRAFMKGRDSVYPVDTIRASLRQFLLVTLLKGEEKLDSRAPGTLRARIEVCGARSGITAEPGDRARVSVRVTNTGDTLWLHEVDAVGGYVGLGVHVLSAAGEMVTHSAARAALPKAVAPHETVEASVDVPVPTVRGAYILRIDLVDEFVTWFEMAGSPVTDLPCRVEGIIDSRRPNELKAVLTRLDHDMTPPGQPLRLQIRATNAGDTVWLASAGGGAGTVRLGAQLHRGNALIDRDYYRASLPRDVPPGDSVDILVAIPSPPPHLAKGDVVFRLDLVDEGVVWFSERGSAPLDVPASG